MKKINLKLKDQEFRCSVAVAEEDRKKGYSGVEDIPEDDECMLIVFPVIRDNRIWMKDTKFPLDIIFLSEDLEVLYIETGDPDDEDLLGSGDDIAYALELQEGMAKEVGIEVGDILDTIPKEVRTAGDQEGRAFVLDEDGEVQMTIKGGERIFSRKSTRKIVNLALNAETDSELRRLARMTLKEIVAQDSRGQDYVKGKTKETYELQNS